MLEVLNNSSRGNFSALAECAKDAANKLSGAEANYINAVKSGNQGEIAKADGAYKERQLAFESISQMIKNKFETMMRLIRNLALN